MYSVTGMWRNFLHFLLYLTLSVIRSKYWQAFNSKNLHAEGKKSKEKNIYTRDATFPALAGNPAFFLSF